MEETTYSLAELARGVGLAPSHIRDSKARRDALDALQPQVTPRGYRYSRDDVAQFCITTGMEWRGLD